LHEKIAPTSHDRTLHLSQIQSERNKKKSPWNRSLQGPITPWKLICSIVVVKSPRKSLLLARSDRTQKNQRSCVRTEPVCHRAPDRLRLGRPRAVCAARATRPAHPTPDSLWSSEGLASLAIRSLVRAHRSSGLRREVGPSSSGPSSSGPIRVS
jgi:hypothetical protein